MSKPRAKKPKKPEPNYYVFEGNLEGQLENASFFRDSMPLDGKRQPKLPKYAHYINGDFIEFVDELPKDRVMVSRALALRLLPKDYRV
jgi:hypothetical protein